MVLAGPLGDGHLDLHRPHLQLCHENEHFHCHPEGCCLKLTHIHSNSHILDEQLHNCSTLAFAKFFPNNLERWGQEFHPFCFLLRICYSPGFKSLPLDWINYSLKYRFQVEGWPRCMELRRCLDTGLKYSSHMSYLISYCSYPNPLTFIHMRMCLDTGL